MPYKQNICSSAYVSSDGSCSLTEDESSSVYDNYDTYLVNELDECGGHSGRGDDYHYHTYSNCLATQMADEGLTDSPWAYALDGYAIYGPNETSDEDFSTSPLDEYNGHSPNGVYHYHANDGTGGRPYVLGGLVGDVYLIFIIMIHQQ